MSLSIAVLKDVADVAPEAWNAVVEQCPDSTIFQRYEWLQAWTGAFRSDALRQHVVAAYRGRELVGLAPLVEGRHENAPSERSSLHFLGAGHADYLTFPSKGGCPRVVAALLDAVDRLVPRGTLIELGEIPQFSTLSLCLAERAARRGSGLVLESKTACPRLRTRNNARGIEAILGKQSVRRSARRLRHLGDVTVEHLTEQRDIEPLLDGFFEMHVERCRLTKYSSLFERPENRDFYRALVRRFGGSGLLVFSRVCVDGKSAAQHFGLRSGADLLWYKPTFDVQLARYSPGEVLLTHLIEYARDRNCGALDFTRGDEMFKSRFCSDVAFNDSYSWARGRAMRCLGGLQRAARATARGALAFARRNEPGGGS